MKITCSRSIKNFPAIFLVAQVWVLCLRTETLSLFWLLDGNISCISGSSVGSHCLICSLHFTQGFRFLSTSFRLFMTTIDSCPEQSPQLQFRPSYTGFRWSMFSSRNGWSTVLGLPEYRCVDSNWVSLFEVYETFVQGIEQILDCLCHVFELSDYIQGHFETVSLCDSIFFCYKFKPHDHGESFRLGQYSPAK